MKGRLRLESSLTFVQEACGLRWRKLAGSEQALVFSGNAEDRIMTIEVGDRIPTLELFVMTADGPGPISSDVLFRGKRVALFGVPGAFTRTCSAQHLPGFVEGVDAFKAMGIDEVICLSVNDAAVLAAWAREHGADGKVTMIGDGCLNFTRAAGFEIDMSAKGYGRRCRRFSMIVDNGVVTHLHLEEPGAFGETSAETLLADL